MDTTSRSFHAEARCCCFFFSASCTDSIFAQDLGGALKFMASSPKVFLFSSHNNLLTTANQFGQPGLDRWRHQLFPIRSPTNSGSGFSCACTNSANSADPMRKLIGPREITGSTTILGFERARLRQSLGCSRFPRYRCPLRCGRCCRKAFIRSINEGYISVSRGGRGIRGYLPLGDRGGKLRYDGFAGESLRSLARGIHANKLPTLAWHSRLRRQARRTAAIIAAG